MSFMRGGGGDRIQYLCRSLKERDFGRREVGKTWYGEIFKIVFLAVILGYQAD